MKVLSIISLYLAYVAARGSGPYLPRGWKPDGPSFYLPSEVLKPLKETVKDVIFSETEASGSDFLREYGPPKVQEITQDILQQGLPDLFNEQLFVKAEAETNGAKESSNVVPEVTLEKVEVNTEVRAAEETLTITESQLTDTVTDSITNVESKTIELNDEITTIANIVESVAAVDEFGYHVQSTLAVILPTEEITNEANVVSEKKVLEDIIVENQERRNKQVESDQSVQIDEPAVINDITVSSVISQSSNDVSESVQTTSVESSPISATQQTNINLDTISTIEEKVEIIQEEVRKVEKVVQNIPELIVSLENEVKSEQTLNIQEVPANAQELFGSLDQAPDGFLEYGPPGFREYGPPNEYLRDNTIEDNTLDAQSIKNSDIRRRRRFSPKFRSI